MMSHIESCLASQRSSWMAAFRNNHKYARLILSTSSHLYTHRAASQRVITEREEIIENFEEMAAEEGQVIGCHTNDVWTVQLDKAKESNKLIVIDFTASWCPPCRMIAPIFADLAKKFMSSAIFFKVDVDELQSVAKEFGVEAMPTFVFMKAGEVVDKLVGARKEDLQATIVKHTGVATV